MAVVTRVETLDILIVGSPESGKSSVVETICRRTKLGQGVDEGWRYGRLAVDETLRMRFMEPPAVTLFDFIWLQDLIAQADTDAFMVVVDSTQPESFGETVGLLETVRANHPYTPCLLIANKQDSPHAWTAEDIRLGLGIPDSIPVLACVAIEFESVKNVVIELLQSIYQS
jgi:uncharacterized protein